MENLSGLATHKKGAALVASQSGEAKASAKTLPIETICIEGGVDKVLERLNK